MYQTFEKDCRTTIIFCAGMNLRYKLHGTSLQLNKKKKLESSVNKIVIKSQVEIFVIFTHAT
jgi:hypothetical protein